MCSCLRSIMSGIVLCIYGIYSAFSALNQNGDTLKVPPFHYFV